MDPWRAIFSISSTRAGMKPLLGEGLEAALERQRMLREHPWTTSETDGDSDAIEIGAKRIPPVICLDSKKDFGLGMSRLETSLGSRHRR